MSRVELQKLLAEHTEEYDLDRGEHHGCKCGGYTVLDVDEEDHMEVERERYLTHLSEVLEHHWKLENTL